VRAQAEDKAKVVELEGEIKVLNARIKQFEDGQD